MAKSKGCSTIETEVVEAPLQFVIRTARGANPDVILMLNPELGF